MLIPYLQRAKQAELELRSGRDATLGATLTHAVPKACPSDRMPAAAWTDRMFCLSSRTRSPASMREAGVA
jgi:hypothetical protein